MPKYIFYYEITFNQRIEIEADSLTEAHNDFLCADIPMPDPDSIGDVFLFMVEEPEGTVTRYS